VGIAFGTKLVMFDAKPDRPKSPQALTVVLKDPGANWSQAPREGDDLLVAVYMNKRPITAATPLPVVGGRSQSASHQRRMVSFKPHRHGQTRLILETL
jgi:hypothetical protein